MAVVQQVLRRDGHLTDYADQLVRVHRSGQSYVQALGRDGHTRGLFGGIGRLYRPWTSDLSLQLLCFLIIVNSLSLYSIWDYAL